MTPNDEIQQQRAQLDRQLHRLGDVMTLRGDCEERMTSLAAEETEVKASIAATRRRIAQLEQQAAQQAGPRVVEGPAQAPKVELVEGPPLAKEKKA